VADILAEIERSQGDSFLTRIYSDRVLSQRTRRFKLPSARTGTRPEISISLLGVEIKVGRRRIVCPDRDTARYLAVFVQLGCKEIAIPYDITKVRELADLIEESWEETLRLVDRWCVESKDSSQVSRSRVLTALREGLQREGSGPDFPPFS
jgi:hypothetical protein